jgi:hypothetical protein
VSSNPTLDMDVRLRVFCVCVVLCVSRLATGWFHSSESYRLCVD